MRRAIQKELEDPLSTMLLEGNYPFGAVFVADGSDGKIRVEPKTAIVEDGATREYLREQTAPVR
jgi:hypothetical protein